VQIHATHPRRKAGRVKQGPVSAALNLQRLAGARKHRLKACATLVIRAQALWGDRGRTGMLLVRDLVGHMAKEIIKRLKAGEMIECGDEAALAERVRQTMADELSVEDRLNEEVRTILNDRQEEMRRTNVSYQEMFKKVKTHLARERKLILR
jgi:hypothetical protein